MICVDMVITLIDLEPHPGEYACENWLVEQTGIFEIQLFA